MLREDITKKVLNYAGYLHSARKDRNLDNTLSFDIPPSVDNTILDDLPLVRQHSRYMYSNFPMATAIIDNIQQYESDYKITPTISNDEVVNKILERHITQWSKNVTPDNKTYEEFIDLYKYCMLLDGECFIKVYREPRPNSKYTLFFQIIDSDRVCTPIEYQNIGSNVRAGIKYSESGVPEGAYVLKFHPNDYIESGYGVNKKTHSSVMQKFNEEEFNFIPFYEGEEINLIHLFKAFRPNQTRGLPILSSVAEDIKHLYEYQYATLVRQCVAANIAMCIETENPDTNASANMLDLTGDLDSSSGSELELYIEQLLETTYSRPQAMTPGSIYYLKTGESAKLLDINSPGPAVYKDFITHHITQIATALKVPPFLIYSDWEKLNFSSARSAMNNYKKTLKANQTFDIEKLIQPLYMLLLEDFQLNDEALAEYPSDYLQDFMVTPQKIEYIDPEKDIKADVMRLQNNMLSYTEFYNAQGKDFFEEIDKLASERAYMMERGINPNMIPLPEEAPEEQSVEEEPQQLESKIL